MSYVADLSYKQVEKRILNTINKRKQLLLTLIFLTGSRVGEIVRHWQDKPTTHPKKMKNPPLHTDDIYIEKLDNGQKRVAIKIRVEKSKVKRFRVVYLNHKKEWALIKIVMDAWRLKKKAGGGFLVNVSTRTAQRWFNSTFPEFNQGIHHLRHWRITSYLSGAVTGEPVPKDIVGKLVGHTKITTTDIYDHVPVKKYAEKL